MTAPAGVPCPINRRGFGQSKPSLGRALPARRQPVKARAPRDRLRRPIGLDRLSTSRLLAAKRSWLAVRESHGRKEADLIGAEIAAAATVPPQRVED